MKNLFSFAGALLALHALLPCQASAQSNLLVNGNFDTQYASGAPTRDQNIKNTSSYYLDQLPNWQSTTNIVSNTAYSTATNSAYVATNSTAPYPSNPTQDFDPYTPHSGIGCVRILRDHGHVYDGIIAQQVSLTAGYTYTFSYYARRQAYSDQKAKLAFCVVYSSSVPGRDANPSVNDLVPTPSVRMRSDYITLDQWVQVSGSFRAPTTGNAWITLGFDNSDTQTDSSLPNTSTTDSIHLLLDDVSLTDMGPCPSPDVPSTIGLAEVHNSFFSNKVYNVVVGNEGYSSANTITLDVYNAYDPSTRINHYSRSPYTGPTTSSPQEETQGFTTFPTSFIGPAPRSGPGSSYILVVTVTGSCGSTSATQNVTLPAYDGGGEDPYLVAPSSSLDELSKPAAYPNPATSSVAVDLADKSAQVTLYNASGQEQKVKQQFGRNQATLDVQNLPAGVYHLRIARKGQKTLDRQLVIQH
jgi:hypothetical protein